MFKRTKNQRSLQSDYDTIKQNLFIDWSKVTWEDLRTPLKSGLAAALYIRSLNIRTLPDNPEIQATIWGSLRPNNNAGTFFLDSQAIQTSKTVKTCPRFSNRHIWAISIYPDHTVCSLIRDLIACYSASALIYTKIGWIRPDQTIGQVRYDGQWIHFGNSFKIVLPPFWIGTHSKRKGFAPCECKFFHFRVDHFVEGIRWTVMQTLRHRRCIKFGKIYHMCFVPISRQFTIHCWKKLCSKNIKK